MEGDNRLNDWWLWEQSGRVRQKSGLACDHHHRFETDLDLAHSLGQTAYRFSLEWSRIEPTPGQFSQEALAHYEAVIRACRKRNLEPIVTLHHFTNPQWFAAKGGWTCPESVEVFSRYCQQVVGRLGEQIRWWITINEPTVYIHQGYLLGIWPPGDRSFVKAMKALGNLVKAHQRTYRLIHNHLARNRGDRPHVGLAHHMRCYDPCRSGTRWQIRKNRWATLLRNRVANHQVLRSCLGSMDFVGLNYYTRDFIRWAGLAPSALIGQVCSMEHHPMVGPRNSLGWEIYPEGLKRVLLELKKYRLPVLITENGVTTQEDRFRWAFLQEHIQKMREAMEQGVQVVGYLYWSLIDNFEWADGFAPRFGLIEVDYQTQERRVRLSALRFAELIRSLSGRIAH